MFKPICILLSILLLNLIKCDGNNWIAEEETIATGTIEVAPNASITAIELISNESTSSEIISSDLSISPESTTINSTTISSTTTEKPTHQQFGCSPLLWNENEKKYCWTRCNTASTSKFFNTWCFTTTATVDIDTASKEECDSDDKCQPQWKCKSSCGMFSPHWDKDGELKPNQTADDHFYQFESLDE